jgi:hypothetical protein
MQIESFAFNIKEAKGYKAVSSIVMYINNVSDVDLSEMKNNWALW